MENVIYVTIEGHFKHIPKCLQKIVQKHYVAHHNEIAEVFNAHIEQVNSIWKATGKPFAFGDHVEDINPEYVNCIRSHIQPFIDVVNKRFYLCKYKIDNYGDIIGYVPFLPKSKFWVTLKPKG